MIPQAPRAALAGIAYAACVPVLLAIRAIAAKAGDWRDGARRPPQAGTTED